MNILYITNMIDNLSSGLSYSVPASVKAQSEIDNCFWYNLNDTKREEWTRDGLDCKSTLDYPSGRLYDLPTPFNKPDIAVFEGVYDYPFKKIIYDLYKSDIPYILIPRGCLTQHAFKQKKLKKIIGNILFFSKFVRKAAGIHYLTDEEKNEAFVKHPNEIVIPNGATLNDYIKAKDVSRKIKGVFIGRTDVYHKGLDFLISAVEIKKNELLDAGFTIDIYGPEFEDSMTFMKREITSNGLSDIFELKGPVYKEEKNDVLKDADLFVLTSRYEGMPMGLIQALSYGIPALITEGTNLAFDIRQFNAGWTAENNAESVADAITVMLNERDMFNEKSVNAKKVAEKYSWETIATNTHKEYLKLVSKSKN